MNIPETITIIAGLGNDDPLYARTYHNAGFLAVDLLAKAPGAKKAAFRALPGRRFAYAKRGGRILIRPRTYMNESGAAVKAALRHFHALPETLLVIHDDADIPVGNYKIAFGRGAGGHRGVQSVIDALRTKKFWRLRIGVRRERASEKTARTETMPKAGEFVLRRMHPDDEKLIYFAIASATENLTVNDNP